jgi:RNA polymerase sigma factor (sigma-70 family)
MFDRRRFSKGGKGEMSLVEEPSGARRAQVGGPTHEEARKRAVVELIARHEQALRRTARRYSICADDAEDAYQRALEIVLTKAPTDDLGQLIRWTQTVTKHEALAVRRNRERMLASPPPAAEAGRDESPDWVALIPAQSDGPAERAERREAIARSREALQALKPQELRALTLLAEGYSYAEIGEITGYSQTKINRCLAEGRERFRRLLSRSEGGERCADLRPVLSAFCDGEAGGEEVAALREHLRACAHCRSALRAYRAAPSAAAALAPALPLAHALLGRVHEALGRLASRVQGAAHAASGLSAGGGGAGAAALGKAAAVCAATAGGAAACMAAGLVAPPAALEHHDAKAAAIVRAAPGVIGDLPERPDSGSADPPARPVRRGVRRPRPHEERAPRKAAAPELKPVETVEYTPPPAPEPEPAPEPAPEPEAAPVESVPIETGGGGSPAGEFGP